MRQFISTYSVSYFLFPKPFSSYYSVWVLGSIGVLSTLLLPALRPPAPTTSTASSTSTSCTASTSTNSGKNGKGGKGSKGGNDNNKSSSSSSSDGDGESDGDTRSVGLAILLTYLFYMVVFHCLSNMPLGAVNRLFMVVNRLYMPFILPLKHASR